MRNQYTRDTIIFFHGSVVSHRKVTILQEQRTSTSALFSLIIHSSEFKAKVLGGPNTRGQNKPKETNERQQAQ